MHRVEREKEGRGKVQPPHARFHSKTTDLSERGHVQVLGLPLSGLPPSPPRLCIPTDRERECYVCVYLGQFFSFSSNLFSISLSHTLALFVFQLMNMRKHESSALTHAQTMVVR